MYVRVRSNKSDGILVSFSELTWLLFISFSAPHASEFLPVYVKISLEMLHETVTLQDLIKNGKEIIICLNMQLKC